MLSDTDYMLIDKRLKELERSVEMLRAMFPQAPVVECNGDYILEEGDLVDAGFPQKWRNKDDK